MDGGREGSDEEPGENDDEDRGDDTDDDIEEVEAPPTSPTGDASVPSNAFRVTVEGVGPDMRLDPEYRCQEVDGMTEGGKSPALRWTPGPEGTRSYAILLRDPIRGEQSGAHWTLYDIPADVTELPADLPAGEVLDDPPLKQAFNNRRPLPEPAYYGPCGSSLRYDLSVVALDVEQLEVVPEIDSSGRIFGVDVENALAEHTLDTAELRFRSVVP